MAAPSITVTNGVPGFFADVTQRPFVTGLVPVVGGYGGAVMPVYGPGAMMPAYTPGPSVLRERLARLKNEPGAARQSIAAAQPAEIEEPAGDAAASRLAAARGSSAGQAVESVADTIGTGTPRQVHAAMERVLRHYPLAEVSGHFHDTYGQALANIHACLLMGIATYVVFAVLEARVTGWATRGQNTPLSGGG